MLDIHETITFHPKEASLEKTFVDATLLFSVAASESDKSAFSEDDERYVYVKDLGEGGMGSIQRVFDAKLQRYVAKKSLHEKHSGNLLLRRLFRNEAQITGALQHSGIVAVYDFEESEHALSFTMREVEGKTLREIIKNVHRQKKSPVELLPIFLRVCETMAYAHRRGVVHRDIKPENIMIGEHDEVLIMDWGLARVTPDSELHEQISESVQERAGVVAGTLIYMSPEQAKGENHLIQPQSDVYSLGLMLYFMLTGQHIRQGGFQEIFDTLLLGAEVPYQPKHTELFDSLQFVFKKATMLSIKDRYEDAGVMARDIRLWIAGHEKKKKSLVLIEKADVFMEESVLLRRTLHSDKVNLEIEKEKVQSWTPVEEKKHVWDLEDKISEAEQQLDHKELLVVETLRAALKYSPDLNEAHQKLADYYFLKLNHAKEKKDIRAAKNFENLLKIHDRGCYQNYFSERKVVSFETKTADKCDIYMLHERGRRLHLQILSQEFQPKMSLAVGSYVIKVNNRYNYPFIVQRTDNNQVHHAISSPQYWCEDSCFVSAGKTIIGDSPERTVFVPSFFIKKYPVTNREYLLFLNDLMRNGERDRAIECSPRFRGSKREMAYGFDEEREEPFFLTPDTEGDIWDLDWPVILIRPIDALEYILWYSERTGITWSFPSTEQWEKALRGADGRAYPWGNYCEPTWACFRGSKKGHTLPSRVQDFETDVSVYGVCGLAGNVQDYCTSSESDDSFILMGGAWSYYPESLSMSRQRTIKKDEHTEVYGFRLVHNLE